MKSSFDAFSPSKHLFKAALPMFLVLVPGLCAQQSSMSAAGASASAMTKASATTTAAAPELATESLPDAPSALFSSWSSGDETPQEAQPGQPAKTIKPAAVERNWFGLGLGDSERASHMASKTDKYILPGQLAPKLDTSDKLVFGVIHGISAYGVLGWFVSSGYSHAVNSSPNYGVDKGAYGERLGAAALRGYSDEILKDSIMANVFHQDPRYYKMGPAHNVVVRTAYSVTRILVTRNDDGKLAPNYSIISGNLIGAALTNAYYPDVNRGLGQTARTFGSSMYGSAFSFFASEFLSGALESVHLKRSKD